MCIRKGLHVLHSSTDPDQLFTLMSPNVPMIWRRPRGSYSTLRRALGWGSSSPVQDQEQEWHLVSLKKCWLLIDTHLRSRKWQMPLGERGDQ